jgi:hypothetical protein
VKVFLASYFYPDHWGSSRRVAISTTQPTKDQCPAFYEGDWEAIKELAPESHFIRLHKEHEIDDIEFNSAYVDRVEKMWSIAKARMKDRDTLLCYEKPGRFCHRRTLAKILNQKGFQVVLDGIPLAPAGPSEMEQLLEVGL